MPMKTTVQKITAAKIADQYREDENGYWISLRPGWKNASDPVGNLHCVLEDTKRAAFAVGCLPCDCEDCVKELARK